jgi:carbon-monoxide dehydrogenase catalytic subunit
MQDRISYHESVRRMYQKIKKDGMDNIWDRYEAQGMGDPDRRCPFCQGGTRCDLCSNGPCRSDAAKNKKGVCGITADGMAMRMMLLRNVMGAATYHYHTEQTVKTLRATAKGETPFQIAEPVKLKSFAQRLGIKTTGTAKQIALRLCDFAEADFNRKADEPSQIVEALAPTERKDLWRKLDIFPGGIYGEMMRATSSCLTNVDGYYLSLALTNTARTCSLAFPGHTECGLIWACWTRTSSTCCPTAMNPSWGSPWCNWPVRWSGRRRPGRRGPRVCG